MYDGDFIICWLDPENDSSARTQLAEDPLQGLNEEDYVVSNGAGNCGSRSDTDTRQ